MTRRVLENDAETLRVVEKNTDKETRTEKEMVNCSNKCLGNLPSEKVSKRDVFHVFHRYGRLAQISIKQAYGFVQFYEADACRRALQAEQSHTIRGRRMREYAADGRRPHH